MKILIVEDEFVSRSKISKLVSSLGYETIIAENGHEGLELWEKDRPRIVITDWVMPGMDGVTLCKRIRDAEGDRYTYIIIVTTKSSIHDIVKGIEAGADDFLSKPYIKEELMVRIGAGKRIISFETRDMVIFSMAKLAESRDPETGNHLERMRHYSRILAKTLHEQGAFSGEVNNRYEDNIYLTSPLHDIGKIGIPDSILLKPGRYDDKEFEIMKDHTRIGYNTLNESMKKYPKAEYLKMSAEIALYHHEKFDGTGYPEKVKGNAIPLCARIVALADVYDALINKRVYKKAYDHDLAKSIILEGNATHFDPTIIDAFLSSEEEFKKIREMFCD